MTADNFYLSIQHFQKQVNATPENPVLLLLGNHDSHISIQVVNFCKEKGIHLVTFPPHCSHRLQPLDVSVYSPLKHAVKESYDLWLQQNPGQRISVHEVAQLSKVPFIQKLNPQNITAGFVKTGIWPLNPDVFRESDFLPASVTDRAEPQEESLRQAERPAAQEEAAGSTKEASTANESSSSSKTPEAVRPYPKTTIVQQVCGARKRRRTRILTDTPEKNQLEAQAKASKKAKVPAQVKKAKKPQKQTETVSSEDEEEFTRANEDSDESLHIGSEQENETMEYSLGDFVLVKFSVEKKEILQFSMQEKS